MRTLIDYRRCCLAIATVAFPSLLNAQVVGPVWSVRADADTPPFTKAGMAFISGSTVVIADNDVMQILRIDSTGKVTQRFGGKGGGPGEFRTISWLGTGPGDSIYVWDGTQRRLSVFSAAGTLVRTEIPEHTLQRPVVFGRMANGQWLVVTSSQREQRINGTDVAQTVLHVGTSPSVRQAPVSVVDIPSKRHVGIRKGDITEFRELPAMDMSYVAACDNGFLVGVGAAREVRAYDATGKLVHTAKPLREPVVVSGSVRTGTIENWAGVRSGFGPPTDPATAAAFAKAFDAAMPQRVTFTEQFTFGADRSLWIAPGPGADNWQRLGNDGAGKPALALPKGSWPMSISERFVLAKWYGDDERVELWRRPTGTNSVERSALSFLGTCRTTLIQ